jgi:hypothetical protein
MRGRTSRLNLTELRPRVYKGLRGDQIMRQERPDSEELRNEKTEDSGQRAEQL